MLERIASFLLILLVSVGTLLVLWMIFKKVFTMLAVKLSKIMFFVNSVIVSATVAVFGTSVFIKDTSNLVITIIVFIVSMILLRVFGNDIDNEIGWGIVHAIFNIADGIMFGIGIVSVLSEKEYLQNTVTIRVFACIACTIVMMIAAYLEKRAREYEEE